MHYISGDVTIVFSSSSISLVARVCASQTWITPVLFEILFLQLLEHRLSETKISPLSMPIKLTLHGVLQNLLLVHPTDSLLPSVAMSTNRVRLRMCFALVFIDL